MTDGSCPLLSEGEVAKRRGSSMKSIKNPEVAFVFSTYPPNFRRKLLALRSLIFAVARNTEGVGKLEETLKWGEPAYLTSESGSGTTVRIHWKRSAPTRYGMNFHCQTTLVENFRALFPNDFEFEGNRSIVFDENDVVPAEKLSVCIAAALTYHRDKKARRRGVATQTV